MKMKIMSGCQWHWIIVGVQERHGIDDSENLSSSNSIPTRPVSQRVHSLIFLLNLVPIPVHLILSIHSLHVLTRIYPNTVHRNPN